MKKSTLTGAVLLLALSLVPETALAGREKRRVANSCAELLFSSMMSDCRRGGSSRKSATNSMSVGWRCRLRGDEFDQYRRVQNNSSIKAAQTFLANSSVGAIGPAASAVLGGGSPLSIIGLLQYAFSFGNNSDNLSAQQKFACERLELQIAEIKKQRAAIAKIGTDMGGQVQKIADDLREQIPVVVDARFKQWVPVFVQELEKAGYTIVPPRETIVPKTQTSPEVRPEENPATPEVKPVPPSGSDVPSVSAPTPQEPVRPTIINEAKSAPSSKLSIISEKVKAMMGWK